MIELFYSPVSGNSARALLAAFELGVSFSPRRVDPRAPESRAPEYLALNPMGKAPALRDGNVVLWESNAIAWYLAERHPGARLLPAEPERRAAVLRWLFFQAGHVTPACVPVFQATNPRSQAHWKRAVDASVVVAARAELSRYLPVLEEALAARDYLEGELSLADLAYVPHFVMIAECGFDFGSYPRLRAWLARLVARPAWVQASELVYGEPTPVVARSG